MRIRDFRIDGFGHFADAPFGPFDAPITVFYGPNEAGKSTLLAFLRMMLFGFPARLRAQHYPPFRGGVHGGRLVLSDDRGTCYEIARSGAGNRVSLEIITGDGRGSSEESFLAGPLGNASKEMFESVFAFSLAELQQFETISKGDVSAQIYSAGMGAANLPAAFRKLDDRQDALFMPRGQNQEVAIILRQLDEIDRRLREAAGAGSRYAYLVARRDSIRTELDDLAKQFAALNLQRQHLDRLQHAWDDWLTRDHLQQRLGELPEFENFPADAIARLEKLEERVRAANEERAQAQRVLVQARAAAESVSADLEILESARDIERLRRGQQSFAASVQDAPKREAELAGKQTELANALRELGVGWDAARLQAFDISTPVRATVDEWGRRLEEDQDAYRTASAESSRAEQGSQDTAEALAAEQAAFEALEPPPYTAEQLAQRRGQLRSCRTILGDLLRNRDRRDDLLAQAEAEQPVVAAEAPRAARALPAALAAAGLVSVVMGAIAGGGGLLVGIFSGLVLVGSAGAILLRSRPPGAGEHERPGVSPTRRLYEGVAQAVTRLEADLARAAEPLGQTLPGPEALDRIEAELDRAEALLRDWLEAKQRLEAAESACARATSRAAKAAEETRAAEARFQAARDEWRAWLRERRLPETILPATMKEVFANAATALKCLQSVNDARHRLDAIEEDIREYAEPAAALAAVHGILVDAQDPASVERATDELIRRLEAAKRAEAELARARQRLEDATAELDDRTRTATTAEAELGVLLKLGSATDAEEFRRNAESHETRQTAAGQLDDCEQRLRRLAGPGEAFDRLLAELAETDHATLEAECHQLAAQVIELEERRLNLSEEHGSIVNEINSLTSEDETSELRARREVLKGGLESVARDWSVATLARALMAEAQKKYEQERQPGVIRHADAFFSAITGGRYSNLMSPLGSHRLTVADYDGARKEPEQLSRGTQEALYLALRFGLIRQFGEQACRLPVIVDEVLVNFDPERARRAAEGFAELAHSNQVLVFTCHPGMVELFTGACPDAQVIDLEQVAPRGANGAPQLTAPLPLA